MYLLLDESKISSKTMTALSYRFRGFISSTFSLFLILEIEHCSRGDLVIIYLYRLGVRERIFNITIVLPEKVHPTKIVRLLLLLLTFLICGC